MSFALLVLQEGEDEQKTKKINSELLLITINLQSLSEKYEHL